MLVRFLEISDCKEGDIIAEDVPNKYGAVVVAKNTALNGYIIDKLYELGVSQLTVYDNTDRINKQTRDSYRDGIINIKSVINDLAAGKPLDVKKVDKISDTVYCGLHDCCRILKVLDEERNFDEYTYTHSLNVAFYAMVLAKWLRVGKGGIKTAIKAGLLHDIGKLKIPAEILNKKAKLTDSEFELIKKHTLYGFDLAKSADCISNEVCEAILFHHEREDKSGYPWGISGRHTSIFVKIVAVTDVYDAMTSDRVYKKRVTPFEVFEMFQTIGVKNFDPGIVKVFLTNLSALLIGSKVRLNTGEVGEVAYIPPHRITEPVIRLGSEYIDMACERDMSILSMV